MSLYILRAVLATRLLFSNPWILIGVEGYLKYLDLNSNMVLGFDQELEIYLYVYFYFLRSLCSLFSIVFCSFEISVNTLLFHNLDMLVTTCSMLLNSRILWLTRLVKNCLNKHLTRICFNFACLFNVGWKNKLINKVKII